MSADLKPVVIRDSRYRVVDTGRGLESQASCRICGRWTAGRVRTLIYAALGAGTFGVDTCYDCHVKHDGKAVKS